MDCINCQNIIDDFIHDRLDIRTASAFADHVRLCDSCYNELEINYCMQTAITELKSDQALSSGNFTGMLAEKLNKAVESYRVFQRKLKTKRLLIILYMLATAYLLGTGF